MVLLLCRTLTSFGSNLVNLSQCNFPEGLTNYFLSNYLLNQTHHYTGFLHNELNKYVPHDYILRKSGFTCFVLFLNYILTVSGILL